MNALFILGNGFDINLKLKTSYTDFYKYYQTIDNPNLIIKNLKENIDFDKENWSDLEIAFGNYTKNLSKQDFIFAYEDLVNNLCEYLENEMEIFENHHYQHEKMFSFLAFAEDYLDQKDKLEIKDFKNKLKEDININVITLNYTKTLESILSPYKSIDPVIKREKVSYILGEIKHIHGYTNERVILGVNDSNQISNSKFQDDIDIKEIFIKHESNLNQRHNVDTECYELINKADLIYIYGSSLGETDKYIWELLGKRLQEDAKIVIFKNGGSINRRFGHQMTMIRRNVKNKFIKLANIDDEYINNIYVGIKTKIFHFD